MEELKSKIEELFLASDAISRKKGSLKAGVFEFGKANAYNNVLLLIKEIEIEEYRKKADNLPPVSSRAEIIKKLIQDAEDLKNTMREIELNSDVDRSRGKEYQEIKTRLSNLLDGIELLIKQ